MDDDIDRLLADAHELINATDQELDSLNASLNREAASTRNTRTPVRPLPAARLNHSSVYDVETEVQRTNRLCERAEETIGSVANRTRNLDTDAVPPEPNEFIDLTESESLNSSGVQRDLDDDVVIMGNVPIPVVDLCSPDNPSKHRHRRRGAEPYRDVEVKSHQTVLPTSPRKENNLNSSDDGTQRTAYRCPICLESYLKKEPTTTICGHVFCGKCIRQVLEQFRSCPICKKNITDRDLTRLYL